MPLLLLLVSAGWLVTHVPLLTSQFLSIPAFSLSPLDVPRSQTAWLLPHCVSTGRSEEPPRSPAGPFSILFLWLDTSCSGVEVVAVASSASYASGVSFFISSYSSIIESSCTCILLEMTTTLSENDILMKLQARYAIKNRFREYCLVGLIEALKDGLSIFLLRLSQIFICSLAVLFLYLSASWRYIHKLCELVQLCRRVRMDGASSWPECTDRHKILISAAWFALRHSFYSKVRKFLLWQESITALEGWMDAFSKSGTWVRQGGAPRWFVARAWGLRFYQVSTKVILYKGRRSGLKISTSLFQFLEHSFPSATWNKLKRFAHNRDLAREWVSPRAWHGSDKV